jgi:hypothetical protein
MSGSLGATGRLTAPDRAFVAQAAVWTLVSLVAYGVVAAIIPNPVFGRQIPPEPFAIAVWLVSAPLLGIVGSTYTAPPPQGSLRPVPLGAPDTTGERRTSTLGTLGSLGAFLAIGCPICNKLILLLLGTSGAIAVYAPLQPVLGAASLVLLAVTAAWRLRIRARGGACPA